jgi:hypothetical protein
LRTGPDQRRPYKRGAPASAAPRDSGFALILVITVMTAILLGGLAAVQYVSGYLPIAKTDENRQAALAAAEAGVDDYVNRLNQDPNYWNDGSDASNVAMQGGGILGGVVPNTGPWGWVAVAPGSSAYFHYYVDTLDMTTYVETDSATGSWGTLYVTSTGKVGNVTRTIEVGVRQADFLSNLYLSNYNLVDPTMEADSGGMSLLAAQACVVYGWQANPSGQNGYGPAPGPCYSMFNYWISDNVVNGPMQSNDDYYICGTPQFDDSVTSADPTAADSPYWLDHACASAGQFPHGTTVGGDYMENAAGSPMVPTYQKTVPFPANASFIEAYTAATAPNPNLGCLYYGPTSINFGGPSGNQMQVYSPDTLTSNTNCLGATPTTWLPLPVNGVIYVANLPSSLGGNPTTCTVDAPAWADLATTPGTHCLGNAFVEGTVDGQVTLATDNNIYLVAPTSDDNGSMTVGAASLVGGDVMGLAASKFILVNHDTSGGPDNFGPSGCTSTGPSACPESYAPIVTSPTIDAVIFTVNDALGTSDFWQGSVMGNMTINGAIVSNFMDVEGEFSGSSLVHGYNEIYNWDSRLAHLTPPYFIPPNESQWAEVTYSELAAENG